MYSTLYIHARSLSLGGALAILSKVQSCIYLVWSISAMTMPPASTWTQLETQANKVV